MKYSLAKLLFAASGILVVMQRKYKTSVKQNSIVFCGMGRIVTKSPLFSTFSIGRLVKQVSEVTTMLTFLTYGQPP